MTIEIKYKSERFVSNMPTKTYLRFCAVDKVFIFQYVDIAGCTVLVGTVDRAMLDKHSAQDAVARSDRAFSWVEMNGKFNEKFIEEIEL